MTAVVLVGIWATILPFTSESTGPLCEVMALWSLSTFNSSSVFGLLLVEAAEAGSVLGFGLDLMGSPALGLDMISEMVSSRFCLDVRFVPTTLLRSEGATRAPLL